jgi:Tfp pilus assembly protein PilZ
LVCEKDFNVAEVITLRLGLPFFKTSVEVASKVAWKRKPFRGTLSHLTEIGVMFVSLDPATQHAIEQVTDSLSKNKDRF